MYQIVTLIQIGSDIFIVTPAGEGVPQQVFTLLFDILSTLLQHKFNYIDLFTNFMGDECPNLSRCLDQESIVVLTGHSECTQAQLEWFANAVSVKTPKKAVLIHVIPGLLLTTS